MARRSYSSIRAFFWEDGQRRCYYCKTKLTRTANQPNTLTVDHKTPLGRGGRDVMTNYAPCCYRCNNAKGSMMAADFKTLLAQGRAFDPAAKTRKKQLAFAEAMAKARADRSAPPQPGKEG